MRPVPLHREEHPYLDVDGCFGCKIAGVRTNLSLLKSDNYASRTQGELVRETVASARATGREIESAKRWI